MRLRPDILLFAGLLIVMSGCGGNQWSEHLVEGSAGPVSEIRIGARSSSPGEAVQVGAVADPQARSVQLQERLLKMSAMMPVQHYTDYKVGPEDALQVGFFAMGGPTTVGSAGLPAPGAGAGGEQLSGVFRVSGQGEIRLMLIGNVKVAGLTPIEIAEKLTQLYKLEGYLVDPHITVAVADYRHNKVAVSGAVNKPDYYPLIGPRSLLEVLGTAGGLSAGAGDKVNIIRPRPGASQVAGQEGLNAQTIVIDLNRLVLQGDTSQDIPIDNGDVVFVPFAQSAYIIGSVTKPGNVLLQDNMSLTRAISLCQGQQISLASDYVTVLRVDQDGKREVIPVDLSQVLKGNETDVRLKPNDIVYVHESKVRRFFYDLKAFMPGSIGMSAAAF
ncbi:MAG: polysaccharide export protein [Syntrophobacteraceae bacterium]|nr:polysaccharide export protein [Syntrophobacteraceae bacterium]